MKVTALVVAVATLIVGAPAIAAPVSASYQNLGAAPMTVSSINACGNFQPKPATVFARSTSPVSSTDCGGSLSAAHVTYVMGAKSCIFHISTFYYPPTPLIGAPGYWAPNASVSASGGATCKVVSQDISNIKTGAFKAVFSMK